ncbi:MAG TPA: tRNA pseudouridine(55) synthase TruB [Bacteroidales bacterium]|nr:tRNA pseudouridine(55) synthase TruB [Bacteroidales bacterium]
MEIATFAEEFAQGKVLLFNKPLYWTSFDLVSKVRNILKSRLHLKKLKVGHAGTLDPLATGLLILCTGKETRNIEKYQAEPKEYCATVTLGATTPSFDLETDVDYRFPVEHITREAVEKVLESLTGIQLQEPPHFSARFMNGTRAYKLARKGEPVALAPREITIQFINLISFDPPMISIQVRCSKGTYIRALARDIGLRLDSGAYLSALVRTHIGDFSLEQALTIEEFERNLVFS